MEDFNIIYIKYIQTTTTTTTRKIIYICANVNILSQTYKRTMKTSDYIGLAVAGLVIYGGFKLYKGLSPALGNISKTITDDIHILKNTIFGIQIRDAPINPILGYTEIPHTANTQAPETISSAPPITNGIQPAPYQYPITETPTDVLIGTSPTLIISPIQDAPTMSIMPVFNNDITSYWGKLY